MSNFVSSILKVNKFEKVALTLFIMGSLLFATLNIVWLANLFGINITTPQINDILDALAAGGTLGTAFAAILGVTLPGWAIAAAAALGATAA